MNAADLVDQIAAQDDKLTKTQAKALVDALFGAIRDAAAKGEEVSLPGFRRGKAPVNLVERRMGRSVKNESYRRDNRCDSIFVCDVRSVSASCARTGRRARAASSD